MASDPTTAADAMPAVAGHRRLRHGARTNRGRRARSSDGDTLPTAPHVGAWTVIANTGAVARATDNSAPRLAAAHLPRYSGARDLQSPEEFLERLENFCLVTGVAADKRLTHVKNTTGGNVRSRHKRLPDFRSSHRLAAPTTTEPGERRRTKDFQRFAFSYLPKPKQRSRATKRPTPKKATRAFYGLICDSCENRRLSAADGETDNIVTTENHNGYADAECQTEVTVCSASEMQRVKAQLRSVKQQPQFCQRKLP
ncbi:hypothetical protein MRX96_023749 [Rhipicephalus microplus]